MKKLLLLGLAGMMMVSFSACNRDDSADEMDMQREEEMNRGDMVEDEYDQSDIGTGAAPSNIESDVDDDMGMDHSSEALEEGAPATDPSQGLEDAAPRNIQQ